MVIYGAHGLQRPQARHPRLQEGLVNVLGKVTGVIWPGPAIPPTARVSPLWSRKPMSNDSQTLLPY
jgi:hypothetical protein